MTASLRASSAQIGMGEVMRLAFRQEDAILLSMVATHAAATLLIGEELAREAANSANRPRRPQSLTRNELSDIIGLFFTSVCED